MPTPNMKVEFYKHNLGPEELASIAQACQGTILTTGTYAAQAENAMRDYLGFGECLAVDSCTAALHLALLALGIGPGDEVITTPMSFAATANSILMAGATPVFADVEPLTAKLDPAKAEAAITPRTKAIMPVHLYGQMCDMRAVRDLADRHGLAIVEDAAHCIEAVRDGLRPGAGVDAGDPAQWEEVLTLGVLARRSWAAGVQVMIEGPGHVPLHLVQAQIQGIKRATFGAPLYVLGPLVTDTAAGRDHIAGAIGGALAAQYGADFLCYLTPAEHLCLPDAKDVHEGVLASRIAAQAGETALGRPWAVAREAAMCEARLGLNWQAMAEAALDPCLVRQRSQGIEHGKECGMCGKFCAIRMAEPE